MQSSSVLAVLALVFSCTLAFDATLNQHWNLWKQNHNKRYSADEEQIRRDIWENHLKIVEEHNLQADLGIYTYWLGMNRFADLTNDEFVKIFTRYNATVQEENNIEHDILPFNSNDAFPDSVDWRTKGCVSGVKDEGQCAASTIFAAVDLVEGVYCSITGKLVPLSIGQIIDCSGIGCTGSIFDQVYQYLVKAGGLESADSYPYITPGTCRFDPTKIVAKVSGYADVASGDEKALQEAVATIGPIAVVVDASHTSFQLYKGGVYNEPACSPVQLDHAMLVVGYGSQSNLDYWIVKNSWGAAWGEEGYIRMSRNKNNQCGIATEAIYLSI